MFDREGITHALELQRRSYRLLRWMSDSVDAGFVPFENAHRYATLPEAAFAWLEIHFENLPRASKPDRDDLPAFANLFSTYLVSSFDLIQNPGEHLYSPEAHCFCPMCSWFIGSPRLQPKKVGSAHKKRATRMELDWIQQLALDLDSHLSPEGARALLEDRSLREERALGAYGTELLFRIRGFANGPAALALWRRFAWHPTGSPKKKFTLSADLILEAEHTITRAIAAAA